MTKLLIGFILFFSISTEAAKCVKTDNVSQDIQAIFKDLETLNQTFQRNFSENIGQANVASACYRIKASYQMDGQLQTVYSPPILIQNENPLKSEETESWNGQDVFIKDFIFCSAPPCDNKPFGSSYKGNGTFDNFVNAKEEGEISNFHISHFVTNYKKGQMNYHCTEPQIIISTLSKHLPYPFGADFIKNEIISKLPAQVKLNTCTFQLEIFIASEKAPCKNCFNFMLCTVDKFNREENNNKTFLSTFCMANNQQLNKITKLTSRIYFKNSQSRLKELPDGQTLTIEGPANEEYDVRDWEPESIHCIS